jgi:hypothetical protein
MSPALSRCVGVGYGCHRAADGQLVARKAAPGFPLPASADPAWAASVRGYCSLRGRKSGIGSGQNAVHNEYDRREAAGRLQHGRRVDR